MESIESNPDNHLNVSWNIPPVSVTALGSINIWEWPTHFQLIRNAFMHLTFWHVFGGKTLLWRAIFSTYGQMMEHYFCKPLYFFLCANTNSLLCIGTVTQKVITITLVKYFYYCTQASYTTFDLVYCPFKPRLTCIVD